MQVTSLGLALQSTKCANYYSQDYFKIFMGLPTTGGAAPPVKKEA